MFEWGSAVLELDGHPDHIKRGHARPTHLAQVRRPIPCIDSNFTTKQTKKPFIARPLSGSPNFSYLLNILYLKTGISPCFRSQAIVISN